MTFFPHFLVFLQTLQHQNSYLSHYNVKTKLQTHALWLWSFKPPTIIGQWKHVPILKQQLFFFFFGSKNSNYWIICSLYLLFIFSVHFLTKERERKWKKIKIPITNHWLTCTDPILPKKKTQLLYLLHWRILAINHQTLKKHYPAFLALAFA